MEMILEMPVVNEIEIGQELYYGDDIFIPDTNKDEVVKNEPSKSSIPVHGQVNVCPHCSMKFKGRSSFLTHQKRMHPDQSKGTVLCQQPQCRRAFLRIKQLVEHLVKDHKYPVESFSRTFGSNEEFMAWKEEFEAANCSQYRMTSSKNKMDVRYFNCIRSGFHVSKSNSSRKSKLSGSKKMNGHCISSMSVRKQADDTFVMECVASHYGHAVDVPRKMLSLKQKNLITQLLHIKDMEHDAIVAKVNHELADDASKYCPVTKKDVYNTYYSVLCHRLDTQFSVISPITMWTNEREGFDVSEALLFHKAVGQKDPHNMLQDKDFVIVLMTVLQRQNIHAFARKGLCVEVSLGRCDTSYHTLITLFGLHYPNKNDTSVCTEAPLAFCISNTNSMGVKLNFFNAIKNCCGVVRVPFLMSNEYVECHEAWSEIFVDQSETDLVHILSPWDVRNILICGINRFVISSVHGKRILEILEDLLETPRSQLDFTVKLEEIKIEYMTKVEYMKFYAQCFVDFLTKSNRWSVSHYPSFVKEVEDFKQALNSNLRKVKLTSFCNKTFGRGVSNIMKYYTSKLNVFDAYFVRKRKRLTRKERDLLELKISNVEKNMDIDSALIDSLHSSIITYDYKENFSAPPHKFINKLRLCMANVVYNGGTNNNLPYVPIIKKPPPGFQFEDPIANLPKVSVGPKISASQRRKLEKHKHIYSYESLEPLRVKKRKIIKDNSCSIEICNNLAHEDPYQEVVMSVNSDEMNSNEVNSDCELVELNEQVEVDEDGIVYLNLDDLIYKECNNLGMEVKIENQVEEEYYLGEGVVISEEVVPCDPLKEEDEEPEPYFRGFVE